MITFENVGKIYPNGFKAVKNLNLVIQRGELIALIGPSGCGKTTIMRMINRLSPHTEGTLLINNEDILKKDPVELRRMIGYVIQQAGLFPHYTIEENIALVPGLKGWDRNRIRDRVRDMLDLVGLEPSQFTTRRPRELSGGQQARIGFARALAADPDIVLMDEPFAPLDPITRQQLQDELKNLQVSMKKTIVLVTHDMEEAIKLGDRIAIIMDGSLVQVDTPDKVLKEPANDFVETFIGKNRIYKNPALISIKEVMIENPATGLPTFRPTEAFSAMRRRRADTLILCDTKGRLTGVISAYDLQMCMNSIKTIQEISEENYPYLNSTATAQDALILIKETRFGVLPIIDEKKKVIGIVTRSSLLTTFADHWAGRKEECEV